MIPADQRAMELDELRERVGRAEAEMAAGGPLARALRVLLYRRGRP